MSFKTIKFKFADTSKEQFYIDIKQTVEQYFKGRSRYANRLVIIKAIAYAGLIVLSYVTLLKSHSFLSLQLSYWVFGFMSVLCALNFGHDAAHHALTGNKKLDDVIFELVFNWQGANGYLWKIRHNHSHHAYPNVDDCDADLQVNGLIILSPNQPVRWYHQYQHIYAPIAYMFYTLLWIFHKDFILFFTRRQANILFVRHRTIEWIKFAGYKALYVCIYVITPWQVTNLSFTTILIAFIIMHFVISFFLLFTFLISHYVEGIIFTNHHNQGRLETSWARHQINVSVDFHTNQFWASCLFGGFNTHVAHHLFPHISHVHYPRITEIIRSHLAKHQIPYRSVTFFEGMVSHLKFIRSLGMKTHSKTR